MSTKKKATGRSGEFRKVDTLGERQVYKRGDICFILAMGCTYGAALGTTDINPDKHLEIIMLSHDQIAIKQGKIEEVWPRWIEGEMITKAG